MSGTVNQNKAIGRLLMISGGVFFALGGFMVNQGEVPLFTLTDPENDKILGYAFIVVGVIDFVIAKTIFNPKKTK